MFDWSEIERSRRASVESANRAPLGLPKDHLTTGPVDALARATYPGMAYFAGTGPTLKTCRECSFWNHKLYDYRAKNGKWRGLILPANCSKYRQMTQREGDKVPDDAAACKYFELNPQPPARFTKA